MNTTPPPLTPSEPATTAPPARRRRWIFPLGIAASLIVVGAVAVGAIALRLDTWRALEPYRDALLRVRADAGVVDALGWPIKEDWLFTGRVTGPLEFVNVYFRIPVSGPKGTGTVIVEGVADHAFWKYDRLAVDFDDETIEDRDLTPAPFDDLGVLGDPTPK